MEAADAACWDRCRGNPLPSSSDECHHIALTCSPIQIAPDKQAFPISCPESYAQELEREIGPFHTLGMPEQIHPLSHERYDYDAFLAECRAITVERRKMLRYELARFDKGLLAFVFDTSDRIQHAFWFTRDPEHPIYEPALAAKYGDVIPDMYREMDDIVGEVLSRADAETALFVLSDHGFNSFRRAVHLNRWLISNGYMTLKNSVESGREILQDVDWSKTQAYAVGFTSLYLNLKGREKEGIVDASTVDRLLHEITERLCELRDEAASKNIVIHKVYRGSTVYSGPAVDSGPDLVIGFEPGYRASWQTALGGAPKSLIEDNRKRWSGDHLIDPTFVPGVFFSNVRTDIVSVQDVSRVLKTWAQR